MSISDDSWEDDLSDTGSLANFIVPDDDVDEVSTARKRRIVEDTDESSDDESSSDDDAIVHRTHDEIIDSALAIPGWNVRNGVVYRRDLAHHADIERSTGSYNEILVPELETVVGEHTRNDEEEYPRFLGMDVTRCFELEAADVGVLGCLCTQNPTRGGLKFIFQVEHVESGVSFLMGCCCAHHAAGRPEEDKEYLESDGAGLRALFSVNNLHSLA